MTDPHAEQLAELAKQIEREMSLRVAGSVRVKTREGSKLEPPGIGVEVTFRHAIPLTDGVSDAAVLAEFTEWLARRGIGE